MSTTPKKYALTVLFNGLKFNKRTDDIAKTLEELKPEQLYTEMYVIAKNGTSVSDRRLNLIQGKMLFANSDFREIFINNLLLN